MSVNIFLKIDDIPGESQNEKHKEWIEILSYSWSGNLPGIAEVGGGLAAGKPDVSDLSLGKYMDKSSPKLFVACCNGKPKPKMTLEVDRASENPIPYLKFTLENAGVTAYQVSGAGSGQVPSESISLSYTKVTIDYTPLDKTGAPQGTVSANYDIKLGQTS